MTHITFAIRGDKNKGSTRLRVLNQLPHLKNHNMDYSTISLPDKPELLDKFRFVSRILQQVPETDVVFIQRVSIPPILVKLLSGFQIPTVYDFDDAFYTTPTWKPNETQNATKFNELLSSVSAVVAGSPVLAEYAKTYSDNVSVLTTPLPREEYQGIKKKSSDQQVVMGWIGYPENLYYLSSIESTLEEVLSEFDDLRLMIITANPNEEYPLFERSDIEYQEWEPDTYMDHLQATDFGIRPLINEEWTRAKSHTSVVQFMALGLPVVVSPVGLLTEIVEHGESGFHANNEGSWKKCIESFVNNREKRLRMGRSAKEKMSDHRLWSDQYANDLINVIESV